MSRATISSLELLQQQQMQSNNYITIVRLLIQTQTEQVGQAEFQLNNLASHDPSFLNDLVSIMKSDNQFSLKVATATYINSAICDNIFNQTPQQYATLLSTVLSDSAIEPVYKRVLERCIVSTIDSIQDPQLTQLRELVFILFKDQRLRDTAYLLIACFCVPDSVDMQHVIYLTRVYMMDTLSRLVLPNSPNTLYLFKEYNQILKTWVVAWDRLYKHDSISYKQDKANKKEEPTVVFQESKLLMQICEAEQFSYIICQIYEWFTQPPVYICTHAELYQINLLKQSASELHYRALTFTQRRGASTKILEATQTIIGNIFNNLALAAANPTMLDKFQCRDFVTNLIKVARYFIMCKPSSIGNDWKEILRTVVFPFMRYNEEELATFEEASSDFATLFEDCAEKQTFGIIKTQTCKLLQKISDKSEQITQALFITDFIVNFCVDSIKNYFGVNVQNPYEMQFVNFDVAITALCVFSFRLESHKAKLSELKYLFNKEGAIGLKPYERTLIYLYLGYNYSETYEKPQDGAFWIDVALQDNSHPTAQFCANDFLFNVADQFYSDFFVQALSHKLLTQTNANLFDAMEKLVRRQAHKISPGLMIEIINKIYQRLSMEVNNVQNTQVKQTLIAIKLITIIGAVAEVKDYCKQHENVKEEIWKVMKIFGKAKMMDLESELYGIMLCLMKQEQQISKNSKLMLGTILDDFATDEYYEIHFYQILNQFITKSSFEVMPSIIKTVNTGIIYHFFGKSQNLKKTERKLILSHLLLLQQNTLAYHGNSLPEVSIAQIGSICMNFIPQKLDAIFCPVVLARALNVLLLCHMLQKTEVVLQYLFNYHDKEIYYNYDIKVYLACAKQEIKREKDAGICALIINMGANMISAFRKREKMDASSKKIQAKYGKDNRLKLNKYKEYQKLLKEIDTPFKTEKKLEVLLNDLIETAREQGKQKFNLIYQSFSEKEANLICQLCNIPQGTLMGKRPIYTVLKPKAPQDVRIQQSNGDGMKNSSDEQENEFKRQRLEVKKNKKNKSKKSKGEDEMQ